MPKTKVVIRPLGKERAWGLAHIGENLIEIDPKIKGYRFLLYLLHEHFHLKHPDWSETKVVKESRKTARFLWDNGFRKTDLKVK
jgi:hypothetical protein